MYLRFLLTLLGCTLAVESLSKEEDLSSPRNGEEKEREAAKGKERSKKDKYMGKSIHELDLSDCMCCTPSYRLLP